MEEMRNYFQELAKENTSNWRNKPNNIWWKIWRNRWSDWTEIRKIIDKFKKHKAPGIDGTTAELIQKPGPTLRNRIYKFIKEVWEE